MGLSLQSIKTNNCSMDNLSPQYSQVTLVGGYPFWQLSIDHNMYVYKDVHYQVKHRLNIPWTTWPVIAGKQPIRAPILL